MNKIKSEILETDIMKLILLSMALIIAMVALVSSASAADSMPSYGKAVVDGKYTEWDLSADYFAPMYEGWNNNKKNIILSKLYLLYNCKTNTMYALVLTEPGVKALKQVENAWIAIGDESGKAVNGNSGNDENPPDFEWV